MVEKKKDPGFLTKEDFEKLLTKSAQPIQKHPAPKAERTSESRRSDD